MAGAASVGQMTRGFSPTIGPRTVERLEANLAAAHITLSPEQIDRPVTVSAIQPGYPHNVNTDPGTAHAVTGGKADLLDATLHTIP